MLATLAMETRWQAYYPVLWVKQPGLVQSGDWESEVWALVRVRLRDPGQGTALPDFLSVVTTCKATASHD